MKEEVPMFLISDRVTFIDNPHQNKTATVLHIAKGVNENILIEFDNPVERGHDGIRGLSDDEIKQRGGVAGKDGYCWWANIQQLRRTSENESTEIMELKAGDEMKIHNKEHKPSFGFDIGERVSVIEQRGENVRVVSLESKRSKKYHQFINIKCLELIIPKRELTPLEFKVGDIVKANPKARYGITTKGWQGRVLNTRKSTDKPIFITDETMRVQGIKNKKQIFYVNHMDFTLVRRPVKKAVKKTTDHVINKPRKGVR